MKIREIENKELRELAESRIDKDFDYDEFLQTNELLHAFEFIKTNEGHDFWYGVYLAEITELPKEDCSISEKAFSSITVESELRVANEIIKVLEAEILELRELLKKQR